MTDVPDLGAASADPDDLGAAPAGPDDTASALDERGQPPPELGGGGLRRELEAMYAVVRADALARLRWLNR